MTHALNSEIARINRAHMPAGWRTLMVARAKAIVACLREPDAAPVDRVWCGRCGYAVEDHEWMRARLK